MAPVKHPTINAADILYLKDRDFTPNHVCLVPNAGARIGRATAVAAAANGLMTVGLGTDEKAGLETQQIARGMGGQMIFIRTDISRDKEIDHAVSEAAKIGTIRYLANIAPMPRIDDFTRLSMKRSDQLYRLIVRGPFYLAKRVAAQMESYPKKEGVIGSLIWHQTRLFSLISKDRARLGANILNPSVLVRGEPGIRAFTLGIDDAPEGSATAHFSGEKTLKAKAARAKGAGTGENSSGPDDPSSVAMANLFIFGFSRFARSFSQGRIHYSDMEKENG